ncbi:MAG: metal-dependent hydrolase [Planctomycetes bacterium]|nr:metal-dependent hydrolase [Planctomycetota bacterium]
MPTLIYHGHACFEIHAKDGNLIIDPFLSGNPVAKAKPGDIACDAVLLTHGHGDHLGDTVEIAQKNNAVVVCTYELALFLGTKGVTTHAMHIGGGHQFPFGHVKLTPAAHGGLIEGADGKFTTHPCGLLVTVEGKKVYHAGDTGLICEMELLGKHHEITVALLPIGDNYTMGPQDAFEAAKMINPQIVVPMHYDTFELLKQDAQKFKERIEDETLARCTILLPGDKLEF